MNSILLKLTKLQIGWMNGKYVQTKIIRLPNGQDQEIVIFSNDKSLYLGQCTPFDIITIRESVLSDVRLFNYVLLHEMGHKKQWWAYFIIPLLLLVPACAVALIFAFVSLVQSMLHLNVSSPVRVILP